MHIISTPTIIFKKKSSCPFQKANMKLALPSALQINPFLLHPDISGISSAGLGADGCGFSDKMSSAGFFFLGSCVRKLDTKLCRVQSGLISPYKMALFRMDSTWIPLVALGVTKPSVIQAWRCCSQEDAPRALPVLQEDTAGHLFQKVPSSWPSHPDCRPR